MAKLPWIQQPFWGSGSREKDQVYQRKKQGGSRNCVEGLYRSQAWRGAAMSSSRMAPQTEQGPTSQAPSQQEPLPHFFTLVAQGFHSIKGATAGSGKTGQSRTRYQPHSQVPATWCLLPQGPMCAWLNGDIGLWANFIGFASAPSVGALLQISSAGVML